jgi:hypothetical protein
MRLKRYLLPIFASVIAILAFGTATCGAGEGIGTINDLWRDFTAAIRRGDYQAAYQMFSEQSRSVFSYQDFVVEYGPLSAARETLLQEPNSLSTSVQGDWAEIRFSVTLPVSGQELGISAAFVRNDELWRLVAARNQSRERIEATARDTLRRLVPLLSGPNAAKAVAEAVAKDVAPTPLGNAYNMGVLDGILRALPKASGLRAFHVNNWGVVMQGRGGQGGLEPLQEVRPAAEPAAPWQVNTRAVPEYTGIPSPLMAGALPDLAEPAGMGTGSSPSFPGDLADPGPLPPPSASLEPVMLPPPELADPVSPAIIQTNTPRRPQSAPSSYPNLPDRIY